MSATSAGAGKLESSAGGLSELTPVCIQLIRSLRTKVSLTAERHATGS